MNKETHTIFASDVEEFARYTVTLDEFKSKNIRYMDSRYWQNLSNEFQRTVVTNELAANEIVYQLIYYHYSRYRYHYIYRVTPNNLSAIEGTILLKLTFSMGSVIADIFATNHQFAQAYFHDELVPRFNTLFEPYTSLPRDPKIVRVTFTYLDTSGDANVSAREIECPSWEEIKPNYPTLQEDIEKLLSIERPDNLGKFIFWHGISGSGKSYLIRSLMREWKQFVDFVYVIDPERFFNDGGYMKEILVTDMRHHHVEDIDYPTSEYDVLGVAPTLKKETPLKLFIIEDGLNFLLKESRIYESGAMSRLLNLTDGILGQGLRLLFLVTSNEKEQDIDPAFLRPGRCLIRMNFGPLTFDQSKKWLEDRGEETNWLEDGKTYSLSDLYAVINKNSLPKRQLDKERIGIKPYERMA
jgi:hypothetical protein